MYKTINNAFDYLKETLPLGPHITRDMDPTIIEKRRETVTWITDNLDWENQQEFLYNFLTGQSHWAVDVLTTKEKEAFRSDYLQHSFWSEREGNYDKWIPVKHDDNPWVETAACELIMRDSASAVYTGAFIIDKWDVRAAEPLAVSMLEKIGKHLSQNRIRLYSAQDVQDNVSNLWDRDEYQRAYEKASKFLARSDSFSNIGKILELASNRSIDSGAREWIVYIIGEIGSQESLQALFKLHNQNSLPPNIGTWYGQSFVEGYWQGSRSPSWALKEAMLKIGGSAQLHVFEEYLDPETSSWIFCEDVLPDFGKYGEREHIGVLLEKKDLWEDEHLAGFFDFQIENIEKRLSGINTKEKQ